MDRKLTADELKAHIGTSSGVYPDQLDIEEMYKAGLESIVVILPKDFKVRIKTFGNLFAQMCFAAKVEDPLLKAELLSLGTTLSYLLNSTSYEKEQYFPFDKDEISRKLRRAQPEE